MYKRRNKRQSEPQTLYLFVEAKESRNSGLSYDTHEILTPMRKTVIFSCVASADKKPARSIFLAVEPTADTKFGPRSPFVLCLKQRGVFDSTVDKCFEDILKAK